MKSYLRLFLILTSVIFVLNVAQAEVSEDMTQAEVPEDMTQAEVPEDMTQAEVPEDMTQAEVPEDMTQAEVPEDMTQAEVPEDMTQAEVPEDMTQAEVPEDMTQAEVPEDMTQVEAPHVAQAEVPEDMTQVEAPHVAQAEVSEDMTQAEVSEDMTQVKIPEEILQAHKAVWQITHHGNSGTAFFIGPNQVVTNFHAILLSKKDTSYKKLFIEDLSLEQGDKILKFSKILYVSAVEDLAVLETKEEVTDYLNVSKEKSSRNLLDIYYPKGLLISPFIRNLGRLFALGYPGKVKQTLIHSEEYKVIDNGYDYQMAVNQVNLQGLSGGPVLDEKKEVIGVIYQASSNILKVKKVSQLEKLRRASIGIDCLKLDLSLSSCIEQEIQNLKEKAKQKDPQAQFVLADMYDNGRGVKVSKEEAFYWMSKSARRGFAPAQTILAQIYYHEKNNKQAIDWMLKAAKQGDVLAQVRLGAMYYKGKGVKENKEEAFKWLSKSARQGYALAQAQVALMYLKGIGVAQNDKHAFYWMLESARQGFAQAQYNVALMYLNGKGVDINEETAFYWVLKAAKQGYASAQESVVIMYYDGVGVKPNKEEANNWRLIRQAQ